MATEDFKRKLTAILSADVKGYSRLMGEDEAATDVSCMKENKRIHLKGDLSFSEKKIW